MTAVLHERLILAVLPADHVINLEVLRKQVGCERLSLPSEREFVEEFASCQPGAMPPFGKLFGLELYCDRALAKQAEIEFNAGTHRDVIRLRYRDYESLAKPIVVDFTRVVAS